MGCRGGGGGGGGVVFTACAGSPAVEARAGVGSWGRVCEIFIKSNQINAFLHISIRCFAQDSKEGMTFSEPSHAFLLQI